MAANELRVGQRVLLANGAVAVIRFVGETHFKPGTWVGVELPTPTGKNNGSVAGVRYFTTIENHGLFLGPSGVKRILQDSDDPKSPTSPSAHAGPSTPSTGSGREGSVRGQEFAGATAGAVRTRAASLARKADLSGRGSRGSIASGSSGVGSISGPGSAGAEPRTQIDARRVRPGGGAAAATGTGTVDRRTSLRPSISTARQAGLRVPSSSRSPVKRPSRAFGQTPTSESPITMPATPGAPSVSAFSQADSTEGTPVETPESAFRFPLPTEETAPPPAPRAAPPTSAPRPDASSAQTNSQVRELQAKLRLLETRRLEDREKLASLDAMREEKEKYKGALSRLQARLTSQQPIINDLKRQVEELKAQANEKFDSETDIEALLEMATLDREVAEEQADLYRSELTEARARLEELQLELDIASTEKKELEGDISTDEKKARGWMQLERENDRLREALIRLRDLSRSETNELKEQVKRLESEVNEIEELKVAIEATECRAVEAESVSNELRQQLDAAEEAAEMIEQLSSRNMALAEQAGRLQDTIRDLETLRDLSEEVEQSQAANERQLLEMLDEREEAAAELARRVVERDELLSDQAFAIERLRASIDRVQAEAEAERAAREEKEANVHTREMAELAELSSQLQRNVTGAFGRQIDTAIQRLAAEESPAVWKMLAPLVPSDLSGVVRAVEGVLTARRVGGKAKVVAQVLRDGLGTATAPKNNIKGSLVMGVGIEKAADVAQLAWQLNIISGLCSRMVAWVDRVDPERFTIVGQRLAELGPVEKTVEWVSKMARSDLDLAGAVEGIGRSVAVATHVAEFMSERPPAVDGVEMGPEELELLLEKETDYEYARDSASRVLLSFDLAIALARLCGSAEGFPVDTLPTAFASVRNGASQADRTLTDLNNRGLRAPESLCKALGEMAGMVEQRFNQPVRLLASNVLTLIHDPARTEAVTSAEVVSAVGKVEPLIEISGSMSSGLAKELPVDIAAAAEAPAQTPPWERCSERLDKAAAAAQATAEQLRATSAELTDARGKLRQVRGELEDTAHERDVVSSRLQQATTKAALASELEKEVSERARSEQKLQAELSERERELASIRRELADVSARVGTGAGREGGGEESGPGAGAGKVSGATGGDLDGGVLSVRVRGLERTVQYLRQVIESPDGPGGSGGLEWMVEDERERRATREARREREARAEAARGLISQVASLPGRVSYVHLRRRAGAEAPAEEGAEGAKKEPDGEAATKAKTRKAAAAARSRVGWRPTRTTSRYQLFEQQLLAVNVWSVRRRLAETEKRIRPAVAVAAAAGIRVRGDEDVSGGEFDESGSYVIV